MINKNKKYIVYEHISPSNKRYIGITCQTPEQRWRNGEGYKGSTAFYNAIKKYKWENFQHNILYVDLTSEEAMQKEKELILKYQTTNKKYGYNILSGGELGSSKVNDEEIYLLWESDFTINDIAKELNINRNTISAYIKKHYHLSGEEMFKIGNERYQKKKEENRTEIILKLWENENLTQQDIHKITGYNIKTIRNTLESYGITQSMRRSRAAKINNKKRLIKN